MGIEAPGGDPPNRGDSIPEIGKELGTEVSYLHVAEGIYFVQRDGDGKVNVESIKGGISLDALTEFQGRHLSLPFSFVYATVPKIMTGSFGQFAKKIGFPDRIISNGNNGAIKSKIGGDTFLKDVTLVPRGKDIHGAVFYGIIVAGDKKASLFTLNNLLFLFHRHANR